MGSSRLPEKVQKDTGGAPMPQRVVVRARRAQSLSRVAVVTTSNTRGDPLAAFYRCQGFPFIRGDPYDVLDRYYIGVTLFR